MIGAKESPIPVRVVDSRSLGMGLGFPVLAAAAAAAAGEDQAGVEAAARARMKSISAYFYVDTLGVPAPRRPHRRRPGPAGYGARRQAPPHHQRRPHRPPREGPHLQPSHRPPRRHSRPTRRRHPRPGSRPPPGQPRKSPNPGRRPGRPPPPSRRNSPPRSRRRNRSPRRPRPPSRSNSPPLDPPRPQPGPAGIPAWAAPAWAAHRTWTANREPGHVMRCPRSRRVSPATGLGPVARARHSPTHGPGLSVNTQRRPHTERLPHPAGASLTSAPGEGFSTGSKS